MYLIASIFILWWLIDYIGCKVFDEAVSVCHVSLIRTRQTRVLNTCSLTADPTFGKLCLIDLIRVQKTWKKNAKIVLLIVPNWGQKCNGAKFENIQRPLGFPRNRALWVSSTLSDFPWSFFHSRARECESGANLRFLRSISRTLAQTWTWLSLDSHMYSSAIVYIW